MTKNWIGLLSLVVLFTGCSGLRPDSVKISAYDAEYPTAELRLNGAPVNGISHLVLHPGDLLEEKVDLSYQGYYKGQVKIDSKRCGIDEKFRYDGTGLYKFPLTGKATTSCYIDFVVNHEWKHEERSGLEISPFKGRVWLIVVKNDGKKIYVQRNKVGKYADRFFLIHAPGEGPEVRVVFAGCGVDYDKRLPVKAEYVQVFLSDLKPTGTRCGISGKMIGNEVVRLKWMVFRYHPDFTPLAIPEIKIKKDKIKIRASKSVSIIALDEQWDIDYKTSFDFDPTKPHILRLLTVKARFLIGIWDPGRQLWTWVQ